MKIKVGTLKRLLTEAAGSTDFTFEVYGPNDETYTCTATYNPQTPFDIEIWQAKDEAGNDVDLDELRAQGNDLEAKAADALAQQPVNDMDPPGTGWDDPY